MIIILTCTDVQAESYLRSVPRNESEQTVVVAPRTLGAIVQRMGLGMPVWLLGGLSSVGEMRRRLAGTTGPLSVVTCSERGRLSREWPSIRRRMLAPWLLPRRKRADLVQLLAWGGFDGTRLACSRGYLVAKLNLGDAGYVLGRVLRPLVAIPVGVFTFALLLPSYLWTEALAWLRARHAHSSAEDRQ